jgi:hypothetical protein
MRPPTRHLRGVCLVGVVALAAGACTSKAPVDRTAESPAPSYIAFEQSFADFLSWQSAHYVAVGDPAGDVHTTGPRTEYINHAPPSGSTEYPLGTIIVKDIESDDLHRTFAMVKRGGTFNPTGAVGWEWFELTDVYVKPRILWRGVGPPSDKVYGGDANNGGCNSCHAAATDNDSVLSPVFKLAMF